MNVIIHKSALAYLAVAFGTMVGLGSAMTATSFAATSDHAPASAGCGLQKVVTQTLTVKTTVAGRRPRTYLLQLPAAYDPVRPYPLVFVFHGAGGNSRQSYSWGLQNAAGAAANALFVFPNGVNFQSEGVGWDDATDGYDLPFFDNMVRDLEAAYCVGTARVFVAGFSWGGDFAIALACHRGDGIRAVAANSTDDEFKDTSNYLTYNDLPCSTRKHPAVRFEHAVGGDRQYPAPDFATTSRLFQYLNSCTADSRSAKSSASETSCVSYPACASEYVECSFDPSIGHALPPNWAQDTWDFFSRF